MWVTSRRVQAGGCWSHCPHSSPGSWKTEVPVLPRLLRAGRPSCDLTASQNTQVSRRGGRGEKLPNHRPLSTAQGLGKGVGEGLVTPCFCRSPQSLFLSQLVQHTQVVLNRPDDWAAALPVSRVLLGAELGGRAKGPLAAPRRASLSPAVCTQGPGSGGVWIGLSQHRFSAL